MVYTLECPQVWVVIIAMEFEQSFIHIEKNVMGCMPLCTNDMETVKFIYCKRILNVMNDIEFIMNKEVGKKLT
jgi:hypothetical protein